MSSDTTYARWEDLAWVKSQTHLTLLQRGVLEELILLADPYQRAFATRRWLMTRLGCSRAGLSKAMRQLQHMGHVEAQPCYDIPKARGANIYHIRSTPTPTASSHTIPQPIVELAAGGKARELSDHTLSELLNEVLIHGTTSPSAADLAATLQADPRYLARLASRAPKGLAMLNPQNEAFSLVWELVCHTPSLTQIAQAQSPMAYLTTCVTRLFQKAFAAQEDCTDTFDTTAHALPDVVTTPIIDLEIILKSPTYSLLLGDLIATGIDTSLAVAGTMHTLHAITHSRPSHRHYQAASDPWWAFMGLSENTARCWVDLIVGSRRDTGANASPSQDAYTTSLAKLSTLLPPLALTSYQKAS